MAVTGEAAWDMSGGGVTGAALLVGGWTTPVGGAVWVGGRLAVTAGTGNLALAGPDFMGWSFLGPISGADGVADNWIRLLLLLFFFLCKGKLAQNSSQKAISFKFLWNFFGFDTDTQSGDVERRFDGVVVDEDFKDWTRRLLAADFFQNQPE